MHVHPCKHVNTGASMREKKASQARQKMKMLFRNNLFVVVFKYTPSLTTTYASSTIDDEQGMCETDNKAKIKLLRYGRVCITGITIPSLWWNMMYKNLLVLKPAKDSILFSQFPWFPVWKADDYTIHFNKQVPPWCLSPLVAWFVCWHHRGHPLSLFTHQFT